MEVTTAKSEPETQTRPAPITNGVFKRLQAPPLDLLHGNGGHPVVVSYKECMRNHAAAAGGYSVDGCGEFMPSPASNPSEPASLRCAACGCHRNFHRRTQDGGAASTNPPQIPSLQYHPYHRHLPPPPRPDSPSLSPPPISSAYPPHGLLSLDRRAPAPGSGHLAAAGRGSNGARKRCRTKFTQQQKAKMLELAEIIGWKMQKRDEGIVVKSCDEIGVERWVFKVWMHNNKNPRSCKKDRQPSTTIEDPCNNNSNGLKNANGQEIKEIRDPKLINNEDGVEVSSSRSHLSMALD